MDRNLTIIDEAATRLEVAAETGIPCPPVRDLLGDKDISLAYAVQRRLSDARVAGGRRIVGRKIGLTAPAVQAQLGVDRPDFGQLFDDMDVPLGHEIPLGAVLQPKCEAEIAFLLSCDLDDTRLTSADILLAIDFLVPAIEVVGSRIANWDIRITDTVADNASAGLFVLGHQARRPWEVDMGQCGMVMERCGEPVSTGNGAACLGSPVNAALWLARELAARGDFLRRGDVVLTGALGPMVAAQPGDHFTARIDGLGAVSIGFAPEPVQ